MLSWPVAVRAQQSAMPMVGFLAEDVFDTSALTFSRQGLGELGFVESKKVAVDYRFVPESKLLQNAGELVRRNVNAIVAPTPAPLAIVSKATTTIPWR
jgi:putative ABC transport system substrate-binding protein